jgi:hypothetical protein
MPRLRKPPHLALRSDGSKRTWVIRDGQHYTRTGIIEENLSEAESVLRAYLANNFKPSTRQVGPLGVVYYMSVAGSETYPIKIGYTVGSIATRISSMQTGNPNILVCLATERGTLSTEADRHEMFRAYHVRNEWFARGAMLMRHVASLPGNEIIHFEEEASIAEQRVKAERAQL